MNRGKVRTRQREREREREREMHMGKFESPECDGSSVTGKKTIRSKKGGFFKKKKTKNSVDVHVKWIESTEKQIVRKHTALRTSHFAFNLILCLSFVSFLDIIIMDKINNSTQDYLCWIELLAHGRASYPTPIQVQVSNASIYTHTYIYTTSLIGRQRCNFNCE